jgi:hypothetical protein
MSRSAKRTGDQQPKRQMDQTYPDFELFFLLSCIKHYAKLDAVPWSSDGHGICRIAYRIAAGLMEEF